MLRVVFPTITAEEEDALERLVETNGWKVFMMKIMFPMLQYASNQMDNAKASDFLEFKGQKDVAKAVISETYAKIRQKSPFDEHLEALCAKIEYELPKKEQKVEEKDKNDIRSLINRHTEGSKPLIG